MKNKKLYWSGVVISTLVSLMFVFNVLVKLFPATFYPQIVEQMEAIGLPGAILPTLAILEAICVIAYLIPVTSVLGAILFTGYLGGAILAHFRVGQPVVMQASLGVLIWLGLYLREPRLHELLPIRKNKKAE